MQPEQRSETALPLDSFENPYTERLTKRLKEQRVVALTDGATLGELLGLATAAGIDPRDVVISRGGQRQLKLRVLPE